MRSALLTHRRPVPVTPRPGDAAAANDPSSRRVRHDRGLLLRAGATVLLVVLVVSAVVPPVALGGIPSPFGVDPLKALVDTITGGFDSMAVEAFDAIITHLFAPVSKLVTAELIGWLVDIPTFTGDHVRQLQTTIVAMGGALLDAVAMSPRLDTPRLFPAPAGGLLNIDNFRRRERAPAIEALVSRGRPGSMTCGRRLPPTRMRPASTRSSLRA